nr:hypothetical protein Q903MT_gene1073 [Picea sitchensis]
MLQLMSKRGQSQVLLQVEQLELSEAMALVLPP